MTILTAFSKEADATTEASYAMAWNIARYKRPYTNGEFVKENILQVATILDTIPLSFIPCLLCINIIKSCKPLSK